MEMDSHSQNTPLDGTVQLPDRRKFPVTVTLDWKEVEQAGVNAPDLLLLRAVEVFGKTQKALSWLNTANPEFSGLTPREVAQTEEGKAQILEILFDLEHASRLIITSRLCRPAYSALRWNRRTSSRWPMAPTG